MDQSWAFQMERSFQPRNLLFQGYIEICWIQKDMVEYLRYDDQI